MTVDGACPFAKRGVKEVEKEYRIDILALIRGGAVVVPVDRTQILIGDVVIYQAQN